MRHLLIMVDLGKGRLLLPSRNHYPFIFVCIGFGVFVWKGFKV